MDCLEIMRSILEVSSSNLGLTKGCNYWGFPQSLPQSNDVLILKLLQYRLLACSS